MNTFMVLSVLLAVSASAMSYAYGGYGGYGGGLGGGEEYGPAHYKFSYGVADPHTGDKKEQHEVREGDHVKGSYSLKEADGTTRLVEYVAGPHSGFNAVVKRIGHAHHPQHYGHGGAYGGAGVGGGYGGGFGGGAGYGGAHSFVGPTHFGYKY